MLAFWSKIFLVWLLLVIVEVLSRDAVTFSCGHDVCTANERFCNTHDSGDPQKWTCTPCEEERSGCPTLNVHPHCYGYCQELQTQLKQHELRVQLDSLKQRLEDSEEQKNRSLTNVMLEWKASNDTYDNKLIHCKIHSDHQRLIIGVLSLTTALVFVVLLSWILYCYCRKLHHKGSLSSLSTNADSTGENELREVLVKSKEAEEQEAHDCEGTRRAREMMTNQRPADNDGPSKLAAY